MQPLISQYLKPTKVCAFPQCWEKFRHQQALSEAKGIGWFPEAQPVRRGKAGAALERLMGKLCVAMCGKGTLGKAQEFWFLLRSKGTWPPRLRAE